VQHALPQEPTSGWFNLTQLR